MQYERDEKSVQNHQPMKEKQMERDLGIEIAKEKRTTQQRSKMGPDAL